MTELTVEEIQEPTPQPVPEEPPEEPPQLRREPPEVQAEEPAELPPEPPAPKAYMATGELRKRQARQQRYDSLFQGMVG